MCIDEPRIDVIFIEYELTLIVLCYMSDRTDENVSSCRFTNT